jgi:hypothetical protein
LISNKIILETLELLSRRHNKIIKEFDHNDYLNFGTTSAKYTEFLNSVNANKIYNKTKEKYKEK